MIQGDSGPQAEAMMRALLERGDRVMDQNGEWFEKRHSGFRPDLW